MPGLLSTGVGGHWHRCVYKAGSLPELEDLGLLVLGGALGKGLVGKLGRALDEGHAGAGPVGGAPLPDEGDQQRA